MPVSTGPSVKNAVRVVNQNSCGSGSICGHHNGGTLVMTNAHVAGTQVGRTVQVDIQGHGRKSARLIMAAYSNRTLADWAVLFIPGWQGVEPVKLSKKLPRRRDSHYTMGHPKCVRQPVNTDITTVDISDNSPLWRWRPNAIPGQSGSAVWSDDTLIQFGLLTWSWGGHGAGQTTGMIYQQARNRSTDGPPRIDDLVELGPNELPDDCEPGDGDPVVENGFFAEASIQSLPIWAEDDPPKEEPEDPENPNPPSNEWLDHEIENHRNLAEYHDNMRKRLETGIDPERPDQGSSNGGKVYGLMLVFMLLSLCIVSSANAQNYGLAPATKKEKASRLYGLKGNTAITGVTPRKQVASNKSLVSPPKKSNYVGEFPGYRFDKKLNGYVKTSPRNKSVYSHHRNRTDWSFPGDLRQHMQGWPHKMPRSKAQSMSARNLINQHNAEHRVIGPVSAAQLRANRFR